MAPDTEITTAQANDLARYFLGPKWWAINDRQGIVCLGDGPRSSPRFMGSGWRDVFRAAGVKLPSRSRFTAQGTSVMQDAEPVATARSATYAKRIANALNKHTPDRRGI